MFWLHGRPWRTSAAPLSSARREPQHQPAGQGFLAKATLKAEQGRCAERPYG